MVTKQVVQDTHLVALLPAVSVPPERQLLSLGQKACAVPPMVGGFQMPLPGFSGRSPEMEAEQSLDWHCYLGSK